MLYFTRVFFLSFSRNRFFWCPSSDFHETLSHKAVCSEIDYIRWGVLMRLLRNLRGENPQFSPICGPEFDTLSSIIHNAREIGKSKTIGSNQSVARWGCPFQTWRGPTTHAWDRLFPWAWRRAGKHSNRYNFDCTTALATRCLILGVGFLGQPIRRRHCCGRNCSMRTTVKLDFGPHSSSNCR